MPVTRGKNLGLTLGTTAPDGSHGVDDALGFQLIGVGDARLAGRTAPKTFTLIQQCGARRIVNCPIHTAAAKKRRIGGIYDGIDREGRDVCVQRL